MEFFWDDPWEFHWTNGNPFCKDYDNLFYFLEGDPSKGIEYKGVSCTIEGVSC